MLAGEEDSKTSIKEELKSFEEAAASLGLEADTVSSTRESQMELSSQGVSFTIGFERKCKSMIGVLSVSIMNFVYLYPTGSCPKIRSKPIEIIS